MKKTIMVIALIATVGAAAFGQTVKIGTVNTTEIIEILPEAKKADSILADYGNQLSQHALKLNQELQSKVDEYKEKHETWDPAVQESYTSEITAKETALKQYQETATKNMNAKRGEYIDKLNKTLEKAIKEVCEEKKFTLIIYNGSVAYSVYEDITPLVKAKLGIK